MKAFFAGSDTTDSGRGTTVVTDGPGSVKLRRSTPGMLGKAKGPSINDVLKNFGLGTSNTHV